MIRKTIENHRFAISKEKNDKVQKIELTWSELMDIGAFYIEHRVDQLCGLIQNDLYFDSKEVKND